MAGRVVTGVEPLPGLLVHKSIAEDGRWSLTHMASGRYIIGGPTRILLVQAAQTCLSDIDWKRREEDLPRLLVRRARRAAFWFVIHNQPKKKLGDAE